MKHVILFLLLCFCILSLRSQTIKPYAKFGIITSHNKDVKLGGGAEMDFGIKHSRFPEFGTYSILSVGFISDPVRDKTYFNMKLARMVRDKFTYQAGVVVTNISTDDKRRAYTTYIVGCEYNWGYDKKDKGRWYCGVDYIQNIVFIKFGLKYN